MRRVLLLVNADTKRTVYLKKAAAQMEIPVELQEWKDWNGQLPEGELFLKIDPPLWESWVSETAADFDRGIQKTSYGD